MVPRIIIDRDVEMRTRDGVILRADVARPDTHERLPAIAARTTYNKALRSRDALRDPMKVAAAGFAYVIQDTRGRFRSEGEWQGLGWGASEPEDGYDFVEWIASQPWCDGNVGLIGSSYNAGQVIAAARAHPPSLKAIAVGFFGNAEALTTAGYWLEFVALNLSSPIDALQHRPEAVDPEHIETLFKALGTTRDDVLHTLPLEKLPTLQFPGVPRYDEIVRMWREAGRTVWGLEHEIDVPTLNVGGFYDRMSGSDLYRTLRERGGSDLARCQSTLVLGPWGHSETDSHIGELGFGYVGSFERSGMEDTHLRFFSKHLRGGEDPILSEDRSRARYFVMGANLWKEADDWPIPGTETRRLYLHSQGSANSSGGNGTLDWRPPVASEPGDIYRYDPADPVPSVGLRLMYGRGGGPTPHGPFDQGRVESRHDVLVYTSEPLAEAIEIVGEITVLLHVSVSVVDTDIIVKLCDVDPDGRSLNASDGFMRCRYRDGYDRPTMLQPGEIHRLDLRLGASAWLFRKGHRLRLQVSSSCFPHWTRNLNTGEEEGRASGGTIAEVTVLHSDEFPSYVRLPVPPPEAGRLWDLNLPALASWFLPASGADPAPSLVDKQQSVARSDRDSSKSTAPNRGPGR